MISYQSPRIRCECGIINPIPSDRVNKATGHPTATWNKVCPCGRVVARINDFGNCNGIKKIKGFGGILAKQRATIRETRRRVGASLTVLKAPYLAELKKLGYRGGCERQNEIHFILNDLTRKAWHEYHEIQDLLG